MKAKGTALMFREDDEDAELPKVVLAVGIAWDTAHGGTADKETLEKVTDVDVEEGG